MSLLKLFLILPPFLILLQPGLSQQKEMSGPEELDTISPGKEFFSLRKGFPLPFYEWVFKNPEKLHLRTPEPIAGVQFNLKILRDKKIRDIRISSQKPLGYSLADPSGKPDHFLEKWGNALHVKTKKTAIRKYILLDEGATPDSFLLEESVRLIREESYVRATQMSLDPVVQDPEASVIRVQTLDSWSLIPRIGLSRRHTRIGLLDRNFLGMGHRVELLYNKDSSQAKNGMAISYTLPNLGGSFVDIIANYDINFNRNFDHFLYVKRDFYSPVTRWAGGALVEDRALELRQVQKEDEDSFLNLRFRYLGAWGGWAFRPFGRKDLIGRSTSLVVALKTSFLRYKEKPSPALDTQHFFADQDWYLASMGISSRRYFHDSYIFRDGEPEEVPAGILYALTSGFQRKNNKNRFYLGIRGALGTYFGSGFGGVDIEAGSFITENHLQESAISVHMTYFSKLINLGGRWKIRQFVKPQFLIGFNRSASPYDRLGLNEYPFFQGVNTPSYQQYENKKEYTDYGSGNIKGFTGDARGISKYILNLQTQLYSPVEIAGFLVNPYFAANAGYLQGGTEDSFGSNKLYTSFSLGFILRNRFFVFKLFQISFTYYPEIPGDGYNLFRFNRNKTENFGFMSFRFDEPRPVNYE